MPFITTNRLSALVWGKSEATAIDWEALYRELVPKVYNYFVFRFGDDALAEDLTSQSFEKAWKARARYDHDRAGFQTWLFVIARNVANSHAHRAPRTLPLDEQQPAIEGTSLDEQIDDQQRWQRFQRLLAQLPERQQELVRLKYGAELSNRAIAALTGLTESNVGTTLHRAVQRLKHEWNEP